MKRLQAADKLLGFVACLLLQPSRLLSGRRPLRCHREERDVLLIKFWGIGSLQLLTPAVRVLRKQHPVARLTLLTLAENAPFARGLGLFDHVLTLDVRGAGWPGLLARIGRLIADLRSRRFGVVYDFEFFTRFSAVVSMLAGASERHGYHSPNVWRGGLHTRMLAFNRYWHVARNFRALAGGEDGSEVSAAEVVPYHVDEAERERVAARLDAVLRATVPTLEPGPLVVLNPNAGSLSLERRWPRERFGTLARRLRSERGATVVLIGAPSEEALCREVAGLAHAERGHLIDTGGKLSVGELCAFLERASVVVSNDSGPVHLAAALGTPTIALFGPETPVMYRPIGERARVLWHPPICSPCINVHDNKVANCIYGRPECLVNISVDEVFEATARALDGRGAARGPAAWAAPSEPRPVSLGLLA